MKKNYQTMKSFIAVFILLSMNAVAQISGIVTINNTLPSSATNFTSFASLAAALNLSGVNGPLTVNVNFATYTEQINFTQAPGISATNTITVNGNGSTLTFNATLATARHTLLLSGADYMTFNNLIVTGSNATNALSCHLWSGANNNTFNSCVFNALLTGTGTFLVPFSISGTSVSATATGNSGSTNVVNTCTTNGGYYGVVFYGATATPFNIDNQVINSKILDFYTTGFYNGYCQNSLIKANIFERLIRTVVTSTECIYLNTGTLRATVEGNHIRRIFDAALTSTGYCYGIYNLADGTLNNETVIKNNVISDIRSAGIIYGIYLNASPYTLIYHNTISLDDGASAATGATRGIFATGASINCKIMNNVVTVSRGGAGPKYCVYYAVAALPGLISNNNVLYINAAAGVNNLGWVTSDYANLAAWKTGTSFDMGSVSADPVYTNPAAMNYIPTSASVNNIGVPIGVPVDFNLVSRSVLFPDPGAFEIFNTLCNGAPGANSFVTPTLNFCPGEVLEMTLLNSNTYTNSGISIQWYTSTASQVGPFTVSIGTSTLNNYITPPINVTSYYMAVITCTNGNVSYTTPVQSVNVAPLTTSVVPYYESFESLALNELPNCYWDASSMGGTTLTYTNIAANNRVPRTGNNFASFFNTPFGSNYFYTNGIHLTAGITYSAALWYITETIGYTNNWNLSILVGSNQTAAGLIPIVSNGTVIPQLYTLLSNTFTIPVTGLYYVAVKAASGTGVAPYLSWDDLSITIPCQLNAPDLTLVSTASLICAGQTANLTGGGANSYTWSTTQTSTVITVAPAFPTTYTLYGENTLSACVSTLTQFIDVNPSPQVVAYAQTPVGCPGKTVNISAYGATSYFWSHGPNTASDIVSPMATTNYSVIGTNSFGCSDMAVVQVSVNPAPVIGATGSASLLCYGDQMMLTGSGALSYQWMLSSTSIQLGNPIAIFPTASAVYTVIGLNSAGCEGMTTISFGVDDCSGLNKLTSKSTGLVVYPNPGNGLYILESTAFADKIEVTDISGRVLLSQAGFIGKTTIDITGFANGIYYLKILGAQSSDVVKIVKSN